LITSNIPIVGKMVAEIEIFALDILEGIILVLPQIISTRFELPRFDYLWILAYVFCLIWFREKLKKKKRIYYLGNF